MRLEQEINQTREFKSSRQKLMVNIFFTNSWLQGEVKKFLKPFDITTQQYNILRILRGAEKPISTSIIRERMLDKMSDTTRMINRMIKKSWVSKVTCLSDKRLVDVQITSIGLSLLENIDKEMQSFQAKLDSLDHKEIDTINELLDKLRDSNIN